MRRHCTGRDGTLTMFVDPRTGERLARELPGVEEPRACDCGLVFDDERRSTIWPHDSVDRGRA